MNATFGAVMALCFAGNPACTPEQAVGVLYCMHIKAADPDRCLQDFRLQDHPRIQFELAEPTTILRGGK